MKQYIIIGMSLLLGTGCLMTRQDVRNGVKSEPLTPEQQARAQNEVRYQDLEERFRSLNGRIEVVENSMNMLNADKNGSQIERENEKKLLHEKLKIYEETLSKLDGQIVLLNQKIDGLEESSRNSKSKNSGPQKGSFEAAQEEFNKKKWKEAIVEFEKFRTANPKSKKFAEATFKIGNSFQELNMKAEAKVFYNEVVEKFTKSDWAKKAQQKLKSLK